MAAIITSRRVGYAWLGVKEWCDDKHDDGQRFSTDRHERNDHPGDPLDLIKAHMFNITNIEEVRQGAKPILVCFVV